MINERGKRHFTSPRGTISIEAGSSDNGNFGVRAVTRRSLSTGTDVELNIATESITIAHEGAVCSSRAIRH